MTFVLLLKLPHGEIMAKNRTIKKENPNRRVCDPAPQARTTPVLTILVQMIPQEPLILQRSGNKGIFSFFFFSYFWQVYLENCCTLGLKWTVHTRSASVKMLRCLVAQHSINIKVAGQVSKLNQLEVLATAISLFKLVKVCVQVVL